MRLFVEGMLGDVEKIAAILSGRTEAVQPLSVLNGIPLNTSSRRRRYAIHQIDHPYKDSTDYDVIIDDRPYPPVAIMGIASTLAEGTEEYPRLRGGEGTPCFKKFDELGFKIVQKGTHQGIKASRNNPRSWPDCWEVLDYKQRGYDPTELFSLCLRIRSDYTLSKYLEVCFRKGEVVHLLSSFWVPEIISGELMSVSKITRWLVSCSGFDR